MVCIVGGMGENTGTQTAIMVAQMAKASGTLLVGFVTSPSIFVQKATNRVFSVPIRKIP